MLIQIGLALLVTIALAAISWRSLRQRDSHGFARFFAWEAVCILVILNAPDWFRDPFSLRQIISWLALLASIFMLVHSLLLLKQIGGQRARAEADPQANFAFENTSQLVTSGVYRYIRHPMYSSLLWLALGAALKHISLQSVLLLVVTIVFLHWTAVLEERENSRRFGAAYAQYMRTTRRFIPFVF